MSTPNEKRIARTKQTVEQRVNDLDIEIGRLVYRRHVLVTYGAEYANYTELYQMYHTTEPLNYEDFTTAKSLTGKTWRGMAMVGAGVIRRQLRK